MLKQHDKFEMRQVPAITLTLSRRRVRLAIDGEVTALESRIRFQAARQALPAIVPATGGD